MDPFIAASSSINVSSIHSETFPTRVRDSPWGWKIPPGYVPCLIPAWLNLAKCMQSMCLPYVKLDGLFSEIKLVILSSGLNLCFCGFLCWESSNSGPHVPGAFLCSGPGSNFLVSGKPFLTSSTPNCSLSHVSVYYLTHSLIILFICLLAYFLALCHPCVHFVLFSCIHPHDIIEHTVGMHEIFFNYGISPQVALTMCLTPF